MQKTVAILGSTGSIGTQTLDVVGRHPERFRVVALAAGKRIAELVEQVRRFGPRLVACADEADAARLRAALPVDARVVWGRPASWRSRPSRAPTSSSPRRTAR